MARAKASDVKMILILIWRDYPCIKLKLEIYERSERPQGNTGARHSKCSSVLDGDTTGKEKSPGTEIFDCTWWRDWRPYGRGQ